ncbi:MAG: class B sortase [Erysipelotrichaceae bacterium]|nr:class B sortase [Erysipelotrichaceae bacterium]MDY5252606.1 class B sortase [Erysipelotrichaceae bacterium]
MKKLCFVLLGISTILSSLYIGRFYHEQHLNKMKQKQWQILLKDDEHEAFKRLKQTNDELFCIMEFAGNFINLPIVKTSDNQKYLRLSFEGQASSQGTPFVDWRYQANDKVMFIYGHNVYADDHAMFSPLASLLKQASYEKHHCFSLLYEDKKEEYGICMALVVDIFADELWQSTFADNKDFKQWLTKIKSYDQLKSVYEPIDDEDKLVILQTCYESDDDKRIWIVAKKLF